MTTTTERPTHTKAGFDRHRIHKDTGTRYNPAGYDFRGLDIHDFGSDGYNSKNFDRQAIHINGTRFDNKGFDIHGFDLDGWLTQDWDDRERLTPEEWLHQSSHGYYPDSLLPIHRETGTIYGPDGFHYFDFDYAGYDREGFSRGGDSGVSVMTDREGYFRNGFNKAGFARDGYNSRGLDRLGFTRGRLHPTTGTIWSPDGIHALTGTGYDPDGYDKHGYDNEGYGRDGFAYNGFNADRIHKETGTHYDPDGFTRERLDIKGFKRNNPKVDGYGYTLGERAASRVHEFAGWNHHLAADKLKTDDTDYYGRAARNLQREGWRHEAGQGWNAETGLYGMTAAFTHKDTGTGLNPEGFTILGINFETNINERGFNVETRIHSVTGDEFDEQGWDYTRTTLTMR